MKLSLFTALCVLGTVEGHKLLQRTWTNANDEVDELLEKQDEKDASEVAAKEFNDANSKVN